MRGGIWNELRREVMFRLAKCLAIWLRDNVRVPAWKLQIIGWNQTAAPPGSREAQPNVAISLPETY